MNGLSKGSGSCLRVTIAWVCYRNSPKPCDQHLGCGAIFKPSAEKLKNKDNSILFDLNHPVCDTLHVRPAAAYWLPKVCLLASGLESAYTLALFCTSTTRSATSVTASRS